MNINISVVKGFLRSYSDANNSNQFCKCRNIEHDFIEYLNACDSVDIGDENQKSTLNDSDVDFVDKASDYTSEVL